MNDHLPQLCPAVLTHLDEQDPVVVQSMWDAVLLCLSSFSVINFFVLLGFC